MHYLVIGGTRGIGKAIVTGLLEKDHEVTVIARTHSDTLPAAVHQLQLDITEFSAEHATALPAELDGVAYCPGSIHLKPFGRIKTDLLTKDFELNVTAAFNALQLLLPKLKKSDAASIVLFSTVAVQTGMPFHSVVSTVKGALEGLTRSLAAELAPGIRVNCVAPSLTHTELAEGFLNTEQKAQAAAERHPLKRVGTVADVANAALYLLSPDSSWVTGQVIGVDGGMSSLKA